MQSAVLPADAGPGPGWGLASQQAPKSGPPSVPPSATADPAPPSSPSTAVVDCEVQPRPSSMQDVQALLHDLMNRQQEQQATLPGGRALAVPAASATASPSKDEQDSQALAHTAQAATPRSTPARPDAGSAPFGQQGDEGQQAPVSSAAPHSQQAQQAQQQQQQQPAAQPSSAPAPPQPGASSAAPDSSAGPSYTAGMSGGMHMGGGSGGAPAPVSVPLLSSAIAAMLAGGVPLQPLPAGNAPPPASQPPASSSAPAPAAPVPAPAPAPMWGGPSADAVLDQLSRLQQQMAAQANEQQRQLSYVQSMHAWASQVAASLRQLQKQGRAATSSAHAAQEQAATGKASLVQLATLQDSSMQQVCQLSLEVAELKEQMQLVLMESGRGGGGSKPRRRGPTAAAAQAQAQQVQQQQQAQKQQQQHAQQAQHLQAQQQQQQQMQAHHQQQAAAQLHLQLQMQAHAQQQAAQHAQQQQQQDGGMQPRSPKRMKVMPRGMGGDNSNINNGSGQAMSHGMVAQNGAFYHLPYPAPLHVPGDGSFAACALYGSSK